MRLNEKNVANFAVCSSPIDKEGYLLKKSEVGKSLQRRWFVLKGNLLFYFEKKQDKEPLGVIVLEACSVQASAQTKYAFEISFDGQGTRTYVLVADNDEDMQSWLKAISHASYEYLRSIVDELQRRVNVLTSSSKTSGEQASDMSLLHVGPPKGAGTLEVKKKGSVASSSPKVKVQNGILVDIDDEEAPPIPPKTKSHLPPRQNSKADVDGDYDIPPSSPERKEIPSRTKPRTIHHMQTLPPHSSPLVSPLCINTSQPLSPPSTLDRTPVLQPTHAGTLLSRPLPPRSYKPPNDPSSSQILVDSASSHPPVARQLAAPPDPKRSIYEMHEDFTQAMRELHSSRTSANSTN